MPYKANADRRHKIPKARYRVTNWPEYDAAPVRCGSLTFWVDKETEEFRCPADDDANCRLTGANMAARGVDQPRIRSRLADAEMVLSMAPARNHPCAVRRRLLTAHY
jgi:hypothetical protein